LLYRYRGTNPRHSENVGLRKAMLRGTPLIYFHGIVPGRYMVVWPVFIVADDQQGLVFSVAVDDQRLIEAYTRDESSEFVAGESADDSRRRYITTVVLQRLHQRGFRERVLQAYNRQCSLCHLRHIELLDAAHIIPDGEPGGDPVIENGLALCKLHHAAFDSFFLAVRPDYTVEIHRSILEEHDGPMLLHGLQGLHGARILLPHSTSRWPSQERLKLRYEKFLKARGASLA